MVTTLKILQDSYKGKKVFVTGHTGFKGAWLIKILSLLGAEVKGCGLLPYTKNDLYNLINGNKICESVIGDIRDKDRLKSLVKSFQPDFIFHLAAQPLVRLSYEIPSETFEVNAIGTANLLDSVKEIDRACNIILITTDKVYHNNEWVYPYRESDRIGGHDPYSASKACAELIIDSYRNSFFPPAKFSTHKKSLAVGRAGNVIGGGDWSPDRLIPDIAKALSADRQVVIRNPLSVRPWQHVLESLSGYLLLGTKMSKYPTEFSQAFNFGPRSDDALPVNKIMEIALEKWGSGSCVEASLENQPHEAGLLKLDINKAITKLDWHPKLNASTAIEYTIEWYKTFFSAPHKINEFTGSQVLKFLTL